MAQVLAMPYAAFEMAKSARAYNRKPTEPGTLGHYLRSERERRNMSQLEFAEWVGGGLSGTEVSNIELNKRLPDPPRMIAIARALSRPVAELYVAAGYPEFGRRPEDRMGVEADAIYDSPLLQETMEEIGTLEHDEIQEVRRWIRERWNARKPIRGKKPTPIRPQEE